MTWQLREVLPTHFHVASPTPTRRPTASLNECEKSLFLNADETCSSPLGT